MSAAIRSIPFLFQGARKISSGYSLSAIRLRWRVCAAWIARLPELAAYLDEATHPSMSRALRSRPEMIGVAVWPYMHATWSADERLGAVANHYRQMDSLAPALELKPDERLVLAQLDQVRAGLRLVLDRSSWFMREGEFVLNTFIDEQRIYSLAFSFGRAAQESVVLVGALQGIRDASMPDLYKELTKEMHGLRPRDFIVDALRFLAVQTGATRILAISNNQRQHRSHYFRDQKNADLAGDYDQIWEEQGGTLLASGFYTFPSRSEPRPLEEIASKKRAMYRRRYELLAQVEAEMANHLRKTAPTSAQDIGQST